MARATFHKKPNDRFGFGRKVRLLRCKWISHALRARQLPVHTKQVAESERPKATPRFVKKLPPGRYRDNVWLITHERQLSLSKRIRLRSAKCGRDQPGPTRQLPQVLSLRSEEHT